MVVWIGILAVLFWSTLYTAQRPRPVPKPSGMFIQVSFTFEQVGVCSGLRMQVESIPFFSSLLSEVVL